MDIDAILNGGYDVRNPNYNPKTKKGRAEKPYLKSFNIGDVHPFVKEGYDINAQDAFMFNVNDVEKYTDAGINLNNWETPEDWDRQLAESQSAMSKFGNAIAQAAVSEVALGTAKGISDLFDIIGGNIFKGDNDYSNPVSEYLGQLQEDFKNKVAPIYTTPGVDISNGGLADAGWWASNLPSVMSSLTLMIPSTGITKLAGWAGKALNTASKGKLGAWGRGAYKAMTGAGKAKTVEDAAKLNRVPRWLNDTNTMAAAGRMTEMGFNAALMRTMENYQEAHQVYDDMKTQALDKFNNMTDEEYVAFVNQNANRLEGVDVNDKEAVANKIAKESADRTFVMDYANTIFDVIQLNALRNPIKLLKNMRSNAAIEAAQRASTQAIGKAAAEAATTTAEKAAGKSAVAKIGKGASRFIKDSAVKIKAELSEGVEEAVNYIAQEEGMHYGNVILGDDIDNGFTSRLGSYLRSPELYDAAFWGVLSGVVFQGLGSGFNRLSVAAERKYQQNKKKGDSKTGEAVNTDSWQELFETSENKRRIADINKRTEDFNTLVNRLQQIGTAENPGIDPFNTDEEGKPIAITTDIERSIAREKAINEYITGMTFRAMDNGNFDMLKSYLQDENIQQALNEATGNENDGGAFVQSLVNRMDHIADKYNNNLIALSNISRNINIAGDSAIPVEYLQIIARDNTFAQLRLEDITEQIGAYETSIANQRETYGDKLDKSLNYKDAVQLVILTQQLATLRAKRTELEKSKDKQGIGRQIELDETNEDIKTIEDMIKGTEETSNSDSLTRLLFATVQSNLINDADAYAQNLSDLMSGNIAGILGKERAKEFETTDEELMKVLGEDRSSGSYKTLATDINAVFEGEFGLNNIDKRLGDDYAVLASLNIERALLNKHIAINESAVSKKVNELHNTMLDSRTKAIDKASDNLIALARKYGRKTIANNLESGAPINWQSEEDRKLFEDSLEILNLTSSTNRQLYADIQKMLFMDDLIRVSQEAGTPADSTTGESSSTYQNQNAAAQPQQPNNQSQQNGQTSTGQGNTLNPVQSGQGQQSQGLQQGTILRDMTRVTNNTTGNSRVKFVQAETKADGTTDIVGYNRVDGIPVYRAPYTEAAFNELTGQNQQSQGQSQTSNISNEETLTNIENADVTSINDDDLNNNIREAVRIEVEARNAGNNNLANRANAIFKKLQLEKYNRDLANATVPEGAHKLVNTTNHYINQGVVSMSWTGAGYDGYNKNGQRIEGDSMTADEFERLTGVKPTTISSTGGQESKPFTPSSSTRVDDNGDLIPDAQRETVKQEISKTITAAASKAKRENTDMIAAINAAAQELNTKYGNDEDFKREINRISSSWANLALKKGWVADVSNLVILASSIEEVGGKYNFVGDYLKQTKEFVDKFLNASNAKKFNGKTVVSFESILRFANEQMEDPTTAQYIYKMMKSWFKDGPNSNDYIVLDNMDSTSIFDRTSKTNKKLAEERLGGTNIFRVQIDQFLMRNASKSAIDKLQQGDTLNAKVESNGDIILMSGDVEVGRLPKPVVNGRGGFQKTNNGWVTDVELNNGNVSSNVRRVWEDILLNKSTINDKINSYIYQIIAANKINADTKSIKEAIEKDTDLKTYFDTLKEQGIVDKKADNVQLIDGLVSIWNYIDLTNPIEEERREDIAYSLDLWFNKLYDTYAAVNNSITSGVNDLTFKVAKITDGDVIQVAANDNEGYDKCTLGVGDKAFANIETTQMGTVRIGAVGVIQTTNNENYPQPNSSTGTLWAVLPNRSGIPGIVRGHALRFIDRASEINNTPAGRIRQAISKEFESRIKDFVNNDNFEGLVNFIESAIGSRISTPLLAPLGGGKANVRVYKDETRGDRVVISLKKADGNFINFTINQDQRVYNFEDNGIKSDYKGVDELDTFIKDFKERVLANCMFNADFKYFDSDADTTIPLTGLATRDKDGNFVITIPNGTDNPLVEKFPSFKHFMMQGGGARWNTKVENGSNFTPRSNNQLRNQVLNVSIESNSSRPVEETVDESITPEQINSGEAIDNLINRVFGENSDAIKRLQDAGLIPKSIKYTSTISMKGGNPVTAEYVPSKKQIYVNDRWIELAKNNPERALRVLIHERLHQKLRERGNRRKETINRIKEIYNDFAKSIESLPDDAHIKGYLFSNLPEEEALEEFLVESLTNRELAGYLNSVQVEIPEVKSKQTLLNKILELLADIFDWKVTEGSLYEKELKVLQGFTNGEINEGNNATVDNPYGDITDNTFELEEFTDESGEARGDHQYNIKHNGEVIGVLDLGTQGNWQIRGISFKDKYRNKGLGKKLYKWLNMQAAKENKVLYSDDQDGTPNTSEAALRVWNSLERLGIVEKVKDNEGNEIGTYRFLPYNTEQEIQEEIELFDNLNQNEDEDLEDEFDEDDIMASSTEEDSSIEETVAPSVNQFVESLPLEERIDFSNLLLDGTVSMKCS